MWRFHNGPFVIEKRVVLPHLQNTVLVSYKVVAAPEPIRLRLRPSFHFRGHEAPVSGGISQPYTVAAIERRIEVRSDNAPPLRMFLVADRSSLVLDGGRTAHVALPAGASPRL
ncbi:MAG: glycogen debranching enzyme N-terminal domain-containing protein [Pirellulales bacterium]